MKRAQDVAQAVVKTRSTLSSWSCIGPRRRVVSHSPSSKVDDLPEAPLITQRTSESFVSEIVTSAPEASEVEYCSSSSGSGQEDTDEEDDTKQVEKAIAASTIEAAITEGELWYELEKELERQEQEADVHDQEEAAAAIEIAEEEKVLVDAVESHTPISSADVSDNLQFYPPGRIMHMVSIPSSDASDSGGHDASTDEERVGIYETPRELYSKLRLSKTMINDHYMPMYKKMMELLIRELENEEDML